MLKNWCFWTVVLEKTRESPLDCKETQPVHPKGDQSWILIGRTDVKAETPILWPPDAKNWLIGKDPDPGKIEGKRRRGQEDEMVGWHHWLNGYEFEQASGIGDEQGSLGAAVHGVARSWTWLSDWTELNWLMAAKKYHFNNITFCDFFYSRYPLLLPMLTQEYAAQSILNAILEEQLYLIMPRFSHVALFLKQ